jgi:hypothetical protein
VASDELLDLIWHWGGAYWISYRLGTYRARRLDNQGELTAGTVDELWLLIREDYRVKPVPRDVIDPAAIPNVVLRLQCKHE